MKQQLQTSWNKKQIEQKQLYRLRNSYLTSIYCGMIEKKSLKEIQKEIYDNTMKYKVKGLPIDNLMYNNALKLSKKIKKSFKDDEIIDATLVFAKINEEKGYEYLTQNIYKFVTKKEDKRKIDILKDELKENRKLENPKIFYLASEHNDSAEDHKDYQGKIYIDEKWKSLVKDKTLKEEIERYISRNNIKTFQWVTFRPVWFITRPNCRHYFKSLTADEVLNDTRKNLINKFNMHTAIGDREYLQTIRHSTNKEWYDDVRNAQLILAKYKQRLAYHRELSRNYPSDLLQNAIRKDIFLINKWQDYINKRLQK